MKNLNCRKTIAVAALALSALDLTLTPAVAASPSANYRALSIFRKAAIDGNEIILAEDKELRIPGTSKTRADLAAGTRLTFADAIRVRSQGKQYDLLLWNGLRPESSEEGGFAEAVSVLAVFPEGGATAIDVAEVKTDRETYLAKSDLKLGDDEAFTIINAHLNAGQSYNITDLFHLRDGRLRRVAEVFLLDNSGIKCVDVTREQLSWRAVADGNELPRLVATIELTRAPKEEKDCEGRAKETRENFEGVFVWDAAKNAYRAESAAGLDRLQKWNEKHM